MNCGERLKRLIDHYGMSVNAFGKYIGLHTSQVLYDVLKGRNGISKDLSSKISRKCKEINQLWLLTGEGEMLGCEDNCHRKYENEELKKYLENISTAFARNNDELAGLKETLGRIVDVLEDIRGERS